MQAKRRIIKKNEFLPQLQRSFLPERDHTQRGAAAGHDRPCDIEHHIDGGTLSFFTLWRTTHNR